MNRRSFLTGALGASVATPAVAAVGHAPVLSGTIDSADMGILTGGIADQSLPLQRLLDEASLTDRQVFLPAGTYKISEVRLPARTRLAGVPGATRLVFGGGSHMIIADGADYVSLTGLTFDGAGQAMEDYVPGLVHIASSQNVHIENCVVTASSRTGLALDRCSGRITRTTIRGVSDAGLRVVESTGLSITDNIVEDCGNGGILVYRWTAGEDGTIVTGNRVERIRADAGGTGQNGNGIKVFRAGGVVIANNRITDCAFSSIRANSADNVQITANNCLRSGETAIYSEFSFEGAVIANNIVDDAANGISVTNFDEGGRVAVVNGNIVRNMRKIGPYKGRFGNGIAVEADTSLTGNVVENAPGYGIRLGYGPFLRDVAVTGNVLRNMHIGIAVSVVEGVRSAVISDNLISGAERGAIVGMRWEEPVSGDLTRNGAKRFRHLQVDRNRVS
ncbi:MAG: TIGR03808 family TAT-translocated repetitive protein [Alphaproteobacteria bacterium]